MNRRISFPYELVVQNSTQSIGLVIGYLWVIVYKFCRKLLHTLEKVFPRHSSTILFILSLCVFFFVFSAENLSNYRHGSQDFPLNEVNCIDFEMGSFDHWFQWNHINACLLLGSLLMFSICSPYQNCKQIFNGQYYNHFEKKKKIIFISVVYNRQIFKCNKFIISILWTLFKLIIQSVNY